MHTVSAKDASISCGSLRSPAQILQLLHGPAVVVGDFTAQQMFDKHSSVREDDALRQERDERIVCDRQPCWRSARKPYACG